MEYRHRVRGRVVIERQHFLGKVQRIPRMPEHRRGRAHPARLAVVQKVRQMLGIGPQNRRRHRDRRLLDHRLEQRLDIMRRRQRRVALQVHHDIGRDVQKTQRLGAALGAVARPVRGHQNLGPEITGRLRDPVVIGQHVDRIHTGHGARRLPAAMDQRTGLAGGAGQHRQRLARKAAGRIAGGDEDDVVQCSAHLIRGD